MKLELLEQSFEFLLSRWKNFRPVASLVLGSGWSEVVDAFEVQDRISYAEVAALGQAGAPGHVGEIIRARCAGKEALIFRGRRHLYEGVDFTAVAAPIYFTKRFDCRTAVITNAAGGINPGYKSGEIMLLTDHINLMGVNPLIGPHLEFFGPRFPDMSSVYNRELIGLARARGKAAGLNMHEGVYLAVRGPSYETPAEIRMFGRCGADAVGMSTVPEAILANSCGLRVLGISCISNLAAGISVNPLSAEEVFETLNQILPKVKTLVGALWSDL
ncbi:MAG: purine-nucleoside phosphorylase [Oligoflexia bacterium]|nr:purine-nucleoside phosphorylase [Oligoflexia bacterium]